MFRILKYLFFVNILLLSQEVYPQLTKPDSLLLTEKIQLENKKLEVEIDNLSPQWRLLNVMLPFILGLGTLLFTYFNFIREQRKIKDEKRIVEDQYEAKRIEQKEKEIIEIEKDRTYKISSQFIRALEDIVEDNKIQSSLITLNDLLVEYREENLTKNYAPSIHLIAKKILTKENTIDNHTRSMAVHLFHASYHHIIQFNKILFDDYRNGKGNSHLFKWLDNMKIRNYENFKDFNVDKMHMVDGQIIHCNFKDCYLDFLELCDSEIQRSIFHNVRFNKSKFYNVQFLNSKFVHCNFVDASFFQSNRPNRTISYLEKISFFKCSFKGAYLPRKKKYYKEVVFKECDFTKAELPNIEGVDWSKKEVKVT